MHLWKILRAHYFELDTVLLYLDVKDEFLQLYLLMESLAGLVANLYGGELSDYYRGRC